MDGGRERQGGRERGGPVREDGLFTVSRDGVVTEQCLEGGGVRGTVKQTDKGHYRNRKRVADGKAVCEITHHEQRGDHQAAGTEGWSAWRQGRSRQVQAPHRRVTWWCRIRVDLAPGTLRNIFRQAGWEWV